MNNSQRAPLKVILCGATMQFVLKNMFLPFASYAGGFEVLSLATTLKAMTGDAQAYRPDVLVIESSIAPSVDELQRCLTQLVNTTPITVVLALTEECPTITYHFDGSDRIKTWIAPVNWTQVADSTHAFVSEQKSLSNRSLVEEAGDLEEG